MDLHAIPLFQALKGRLGWLDARQKVVAENVANSDTPGFVPRDLKAQSFDAVLKRSGPSGVAPVRLLASNPGHMAAPDAEAGTWGATRAPDSETTLDGNAVVLEEQMLKMAESRMAYDAAIGFYQKSMGMLRLAARAPGR